MTFFWTILIVKDANTVFLPSACNENKQTYKNEQIMYRIFFLYKKQYAVVEPGQSELNYANTNLHIEMKACNFSDTYK